jgi:dihydroorotase
MPAPRPIAFVNARLVDPTHLKVSKGGLIVENGLIADVSSALTRDLAPPDAVLIDCDNDVLAPGLVDLRCFIGEPGAEHRESIASASTAAAAGGVTTIVSRPDTSPPVDDPAVVDFIRRRSSENSIVTVLPTAAITKGILGREIAEYGLLAEAGAVAFSDGDWSIESAQVMRQALRCARDFDVILAPNVADRALSAMGVIAEGALATRLGLASLPREAETIALDRDLRLVKLTGARYHAAKISNALSIAAMARAKEEGLFATCGVTVNHLTLNENDIGDYRTFLKLRPPLVREDERALLVEALAEGVIDVIVSDHDPQDVETKRLPFGEAADGAIGLETMLSASLRLVSAGRLSLPKLWRALSLRPAEILGLPGGRLARGAPADLVRVAIDEPYVLDPANLHSRCHNTPFAHERLEGRVKMTLIAGKTVYQ